MLKALFTSADIQNALNRHKISLENEIIERVAYVGETFINNARNNGDYKDQTGNLRSSIGYYIVFNGQIDF